MPLVKVIFGIVIAAVLMSEICPALSYLITGILNFSLKAGVWSSANVDIKLDSLKERADRRDNIIGDLKDGYVSAANTNQPLIYTV